MISDNVRMAAYDQALRMSVDSSSVVLDIGSGTGIFALLACRYGARRVFAVEPSDALQVARDIARDNGVADRIEFFNDLSTNIELPEPATVIISDLRSILPLFQGHCETITDARTRLLAPDGVLIPRQDTLWIALVSGPEAYRHTVGPYQHNRYDLDMGAAHRFVTNEWRKGSKVTQDDLFMEPQCWAVLDYYSWADPDVSGENVWEVTKSETINGFSVWFDALLAEGVGFSNAPGAPELIYNRGFFPLSEPIDVSPGDRIQVNLRAKLLGDGYIWYWETKVASAEEDELRADFKQSTFFRVPLSLAQLRKRTSDYVPELGGDGSLQRFILDAIDGVATVQEIAEQVASSFPDRFPSWQDAFHDVAQLSQQYSR
jgi:protein arginine N-methyltransferase 1